MSGTSCEPLAQGMAPLTGLVAPCARSEAELAVWPSPARPRLLVSLDRGAGKSGCLFFRGWRGWAKGLVAKVLPGGGDAPRWYRRDPHLAEIMSGLGASAMALSLGTPGPYNKPVAVFLGPDGPLGVAKFGTTPEAQGLVAHEERWLEALAAQDTLAVNTPRLLLREEWEGVRCLVQSVGQGKRPCAPDPGLFAQFLARFQATALDSGADIPPVRLRRHYENLAPRMSRKWSELFLSCLESLDLAWDEKLLLVPAHRDFSYWNALADGRELFVFDWEYAAGNMPPLLDLFHHLLLPKVQRGKLKPKDLDRAADKALKAAQGVLPDAALRWPKLQLLVYLLDLCLIYLESRGGRPGDCRVLPRYGLLLRTKEEWL